MDFHRRRIAGLAALVPTPVLNMRSDESAESLSTTSTTAAAESATNTVAPYHTSLNGVNQPMNLLFKDLLWWTLGIIALALLAIRVAQLVWSWLRRISAMSQTKEQQNYWRLAQWDWMPSLKQKLIYAPLWKKRHNREFRLSSAVNVGTLPGRLHALLLFIYVGSNVAYMLILNWDSANKYALLAELRGRSGTLALVNMVPLVILAGRNNPLIWLLCVSFDTYNLIHRWLGRLVVIEVLVHTGAWWVVQNADGGWKAVSEAMTTNMFIGSGTVGAAAMLMLMLLALSPLRHAFYETFLNGHIVLALVSFACTWVHCATATIAGGLPQLPWIMAIFVLWFCERLARMLRLVYVNWSDRGWTEAVVEAMPGECTRVTVHLPRFVDVDPGTHAYLRFAGVRPWESHPFSVAWVEHKHRRGAGKLPLFEEKNLPPADRADATTSVSFVVGARTGMTRRLYEKALSAGPARTVRLRAAVEGPYAGHHSLDSYGHAVLFAGSTGITHQMSHLRHLIEGFESGIVATRRVTLVWIVRDYEALEWVRPWMDTVLRLPRRKEILRVQLFITRPRNPREITSASSTVQMFPGRPNIPLLLAKEVQEQAGAMCVTVCGPGALADDVRGAVRGVQGLGSVVDFVEESFTW